MRCEHADAPVVGRGCPHLDSADYRIRFSGRGRAYDMVCTACAAEADPALVEMCAACHASARAAEASGIDGEPEIAERASALRFAHRTLALPAGTPELLDVQPVLAGDRSAWIALAADGQLYALELRAGRAELRAIARVPAGIVSAGEPAVLRVSRGGELAAVASRRGQRGAILDLATGAVTLALARDTYQHQHSDFALAFVERGGRTLVAHATRWNRLDVSDARTGELVTARASPEYARGASPPHYLDYFHCGLVVSPDQQRIAEDGWVWAPVGLTVAWSLERWLADNPWESEDGPSRRRLCQRSYSWNGALCWLAGARLAVYGFGDDDAWMVPAVRIFDTDTGAELAWFPGPRGELVYDRVLVSLDPVHGAAVWDVDAGARLLADPSARLARYHPSAKTFLGWTATDLAVATLGGHHAEAAWSSDLIRRLARTIRDDRAFDGLPVLADALELAGCPEDELLAHCRAPGEHGDTCWAVDQLLAR